MRRLLIGIACAVVILTAGLVGGYFYFTKPYYEPGMVRRGTELRDPLAAPQQNPVDASTWVVAKDIRLHHFSVGSGPDVLFLHGGPGMPPYGPLPGVRQVGPDYRVHFYHQRGSGKSTRPVDRPSGNARDRMLQVVRVLGIQEQVADVERIRRILDRERLILIGHSFGGFLAALYAAEFPEHVEALVLVAPANLFRFPPPPGHDLFTIIEGRLKGRDLAEFQESRKRLMDFSSTIEKSDAELAAFNWQIGDFFVRAAGADAIPSALGQLVRPEGTAGWGVQALYFSMGMRYDIRSELKRIKCPVLVIHGKRDLIPEGATRGIADEIEGSRFQALDTGHFPFAERPDEFSALVRQFLKSSGGGASPRP